MGLETAARSPELVLLNLRSEKVDRRQRILEEELYGRKMVLKCARGRGSRRRRMVLGAEDLDSDRLFSMAEDGLNLPAAGDSWAEGRDGTAGGDGFPARILGTVGLGGAALLFFVFFEPVSLRDGNLS